MSFVEWIGVTVVCFIAIGVAGFVVSSFGMKDEDGEVSCDGEKGPKEFGNYVFFIVVMCVVFFTLVNIG